MLRHKDSNSRKYCHSYQTDSSLADKEISFHFMDPECPLPHSQQSAFKEARKKISKHDRRVRSIFHSFLSRNHKSPHVSWLNRTPEDAFLTSAPDNGSAVNCMPDLCTGWNTSRRRDENKNPARRESKPNSLVVQALRLPYVKSVTSAVLAVCCRANVFKFRRPVRHGIGIFAEPL
jgi:hypothetical protein